MRILSIDLTRRYAYIKDIEALVRRSPFTLKRKHLSSRTDRNLGEPTMTAEIIQRDDGHTWGIEDGFKVNQLPAYRASNGALASQLTTIRSEAENWANTLNRGYRPMIVIRQL